MNFKNTGKEIEEVQTKLAEMLKLHKARISGELAELDKEFNKSNNQARGR